MNDAPVFQLADFVASPTQEPVNLELAAGGFVTLAMNRGERRALLRAVLTAKNHRGRMLLPPDGWTPGSESPITLVVRNTPPRHRVAVWLAEPAFPSLAPAESLLLAARTGGSRLYDPERLLTPLGLPTGDGPAGRLSGPDRVKLGLATALASEPVVVLGDDPLAGLDSGIRENLFELLSSLLGSSSCLYLDGGGC
jgi:ABC-type branched-subunit amino acid transport system ATPase component